MKNSKAPFSPETIRLILAVMLYPLFSVAQNNVPGQLTLPYDHYIQNTLQEKLYAHTDKEVYLPGEIIWFKLYIVDAVFHKPLDMSKVAYAELIDSANHPVQQGKIAMESGEGSGSFLLKQNIPSGNYTFRAYTNWMKNFSPDFYFRKQITIFNPNDLYAGADTVTEPSHHIAFYPEGGNFVNGIAGKVAFRVTGTNQKDEDFRGYLVNDQQDTLTLFRPLKHGSGTFEYTPSQDHSSSAVIRFPDGSSMVQKLPAAAGPPYAMRLQRENDRLKITVSSTGSGNLYTIAHTRGSVKSAQSASLVNGTATFWVELKNLGEGVSVITVFNDAKQPVCERLYFKYPGQELNLHIDPDKNQYETRQEVNLKITSTNEKEKATPASLSVAVFRLDSLEIPAGMDIKSYFLLTSDLPGNIEDPGYYFNAENDADREAAMDNLMLTNGWRRFNWEKINTSTTPTLTFAPEYYGHQINGKITDSRTGNGIKNANAYLSVPGTLGLFANATSDSAGTVKFQFKNFYGNEVIAQTDPLTDSNYSVEINSPFSAVYSQYKPAPFRIPVNYPRTLLNHSLSMQVQRLYNGSKMNRFNAYNADTLPFYQQPDTRYVLDEYRRFTSMEEVFREFVRNVFVSKSGGRTRLAMFQEESQSTFNGQPLVLIDGVPVFNTATVMAYDPLNVRTIDVVAHKYYMGRSEYDGIVNMTTYEGNLKGYELAQNAVVIDYEGLQLQREFYAPDYSTPALRESRLPDYRNVLYWSPTVRTNAAGAGNISCYSSDLPGRYAAVVQGITAEGLVGSSSVIFEVKEK